jgi:hypothetical protein
VAQPSLPGHAHLTQRCRRGAVAWIAASLDSVQLKWLNAKSCTWWPIAVATPLPQRLVYGVGSSSAGRGSDMSGESPSGAGSGEVSDDEVNSAAFTIAEGSSLVSLALALPVTHVATRHTPREI